MSLVGRGKLQALVYDILPQKAMLEVCLWASVCPWWDGANSKHLFMTSFLGKRCSECVSGPMCVPGGTGQTPSTCLQHLSFRRKVPESDARSVETGACAECLLRRPIRQWSRESQLTALPDHPGRENCPVGVRGN